MIIDDIYQDVSEIRKSGENGREKRLDILEVVNKHSAILDYSLTPEDITSLQDISVHNLINLLDGFLSDIKRYADKQKGNEYHNALVDDFFTLVFQQSEAIQVSLENDEYLREEYVFVRLFRLQTEIYLKKFFVDVKLGRGDDIEDTTKTLIESLNSNARSKFYIRVINPKQEQAYLWRVKNEVNSLEDFITSLIIKGYTKDWNEHNRLKILNVLSRSQANPKYSRISNSLKNLCVELENEHKALK